MTEKYDPRITFLNPKHDNRSVTFIPEKINYIKYTRYSNTVLISGLSTDYGKAKVIQDVELAEYKALTALILPLSNQFVEGFGLSHSYIVNTQKVHFFKRRGIWGVTIYFAEQSDDLLYTQEFVPIDDHSLFERLPKDRALK